MLFLSIDANFKLRLKDRGIHSDVRLGSGWSYYVDSIKYSSTMSSFGNEIDVRFLRFVFLFALIDSQENTCESQHNAIVQANTRNTKGYKASGAAMVICGRHTLVRANGVADLQKGERCVILFLPPRLKN